MADTPTGNGHLALDGERITGEFRHVGLLVNDIEFVPLDIVRAHMPFVVPYDVKVQAVYVEVES